MNAIVRKELLNLFYSPLAWAVSTVYALLFGYLFNVFVHEYSKASIQQSIYGPITEGPMEQLVSPSLWWAGFFLFFLIPMITMGSFAEEKRQGTLELLFSYPISDWQLVLGKFIGQMSLLIFMTSLTLWSYFSISFSLDLNWKVVLLGYLGLVLLSATLVSLGLWISSTTSSQVMAASLTYGSFMMLWLLSFAGQSVRWVTDRIGSFSLLNPLEEMSRGLLTSHGMLFYLALTVFFLFMTVRVLESRTWSPS